MAWVSVWDDEAAVARWPVELQLALQRRPHPELGSTVFDPPNGTDAPPEYSDQSELSTRAARPLPGAARPAASKPQNESDHT